MLLFFTVQIDSKSSFRSLRLCMPNEHMELFLHTYLVYNLKHGVPCTQKAVK